MILQALSELCDRESLLGSDPNYQLKRVPWIVCFAADGTFLRMIDNRTMLTIPPRSSRGKPRTVYRSRYRWVPREPERTSGDYPFFLCDTTEYVFGRNAPAKKGTGRAETKLKERRNLFFNKAKQCYDDTQDEAVGALLVMLKSIENEVDRLVKAHYKTGHPGIGQGYVTAACNLLNK